MRKNTDNKMRDEIVENAGRAPGGLSDPADIGLLVCYLLAHLGRPLSREQLDEIVPGSGLVNYFDFSNAFGQLCQRGQILSVEDGFTVSAEARHAADVLADSLPVSVCSKILGRGLRVLRREDSQAENNIAIEDDEAGGVSLVCNMEDKKGPLMSVRAAIGSSGLAASLGSRFLEDPELLYNAVFAVLSGDKRGLQEIASRMK